MNDLQFGSVIRAIRKRRGLSQIELAALAGVSHGTVSLVERGHSDRLALLVLRRVASALDARVELLARWRGGELDRLLSRRHSALRERFAEFVLGQPGWVVEPEVSFSDADAEQDRSQVRREEELQRSREPSAEIARPADGGPTSESRDRP